MSDYGIHIGFRMGDTNFNLKTDTAEEMIKLTAEFAAASKGILDNLEQVLAAGKATEAFKEPEKVVARPPVNAGSRPGSTSDVPTCKHNVPYNDVRGKTYQKGPKSGQAYPKSFYSACGKGCDAID